MKKILRKFFHILPFPIRKLIKNFLFKVNNIPNPILQNYYNKKLFHIIEDSKDKIKGIIIYLPTIDWQTPLFQRPHQIAMKMAELCYLFLYVTPNIKEKIKGITIIKKNLIVTNIPISFLLNSINPEIKIIVYISWASNKYMLSSFGKRLDKILLYDYIDELDVFYQYGPEMEKDHDYLLKNSDIVLVTANNLYKKAKEIKNETILCPNGVDYELFKKTKEVNQKPYDISEFIDPNKTIIGYHGALANWIDYELIKFIANNFKESEIFLIGPDYDGSLKSSKIYEFKNIHWLGPKKYEDLPKYLRWFDVAILPFKINKITLSTSPIKMFEYMAAGIPIVSVNLPEPKKYSSVLIAKDYDEFIKLIYKAKNLKNNKNYLKLIDKEAKENSWENRAKIIDEVIQKKLNEKKLH